MKEALFEELASAVINLDLQSACNLARRVVDSGLNALEAIEQGLVKGLKVVGDKFGSGEYFLPELMRGAKVVQEAVKILEPRLSGTSSSTKGTIVLGTVKGDIHDIGKNLVSTMLSANGVRVIDIGVDCSTEKFINKALEVNAQIIGASALLTLTITKQKELIETLEQKGLRDRFKVIVGGAAVDPTWAREIGADGYAENAHEAVNVVSRLLRG